MTFGAMAAWQAWLLLAGAGALAAWLFLLKLRAPRTFVPSLLLWARVLDEPREVTLWERIRRAVSLVLTIIIALTLALAVSRPSRSAGGSAATHGRLLVVIDSSWSMQAKTGSGETRWQRAIAEAQRITSAAGGDLVALATTADGIVEGPTTDLGLIESALDRISPAGGDATFWPSLDGAAVHFITDGAVVRPLDASVVVHSVFESASNVAVTALEVRPPLSAEHAADAYLEVANFSTAAQKVRLTLTRGAGAVFERDLDMAAGEVLRQIVPLLTGADPALRAHVEAPNNALETDDDAYAWVRRARPLKLSVVGEQTAWLRRLLQLDPDVEAEFIRPAAYRPGQEDAIIFDRWAPDAPPDRPALYFAPPIGIPWLNDASGAVDVSMPAEEQQPVWDRTSDHPVARGVDPVTLSIKRAQQYRHASFTPIARSSRGLPLVSVSKSRSRRAVLVAFDAGESNLASAPAFPVLVGNAIEWLTRPVTADARRPGMMSFDETITSVIGPRGAQLPLTRLDHATFAVVREPGLYVAEAGGSRSAFAVNVGDQYLSNLSRIHLAATDARQVALGASGLPWWVYFAVAAFALGLLEWWTWQRRITV